MNLLILKTNWTASMTETVAAAARRVALPATKVTALSGTGTASASIKALPMRP